MTEIRDKVDLFMQQEMPQIQMHGGDWRVTDVERGAISIELDDACSGCGISPMTIQAIKNRMPKKIDEVESVDATVASDDPTSGPF